MCVCVRVCVYVCMCKCCAQERMEKVPLHNVYWHTGIRVCDPYSCVSHVGPSS